METRYLSLMVLLFLVLSLVSNTLLAQSCNSKIVASTPNKRFHVNQNGTVTDTLTGLRWARCSLGQTFENDACRGEAHQLPWAIVSLKNFAEDGCNVCTLRDLMVSSY